MKKRKDFFTFKKNFKNYFTSFLENPKIKTYNNNLGYWLSESETQVSKILCRLFGPFGLFFNVGWSLTLILGWADATALTIGPIPRPEQKRCRFSYVTLNGSNDVVMRLCFHLISHHVHPHRKPHFSKPQNSCRKLIHGVAR